jgi:hypothetical protein
VDRVHGLRSGPREREREILRVRFFDAFAMGIEDVVERVEQIEPLEQMMEPSVRVRDDDEANAAVAQRRQRRPHVVGHELPEVRALVVVVQLR